MRLTYSELEEKLDQEILKIRRWAKGIEERLGPDFKLSFLKAEKFQTLFTLCTFEVKTSLTSRIVKEAIREEAEQYRDGRLYFPVYNDVTGRLHLQFYSFYLLRRGVELVED